MSFSFTNETRDWIRKAVDEDRGTGDITTLATVDPSMACKAKIISKGEGVFCGRTVVDEVFHWVDSGIRVSWYVDDGQPVSPGTVCCDLVGPTASILIAERTALNFAQRLCGIATLTSKFVHEVRHTSCRILDTRKTTPLWRELEKHAVRSGGGISHRRGLFDMFLLKENHIAAAGGLEDAIRRALAFRERMEMRPRIEVEVRSLHELKQALNFPIDRVMLDNMDVTEIALAVTMVRRACEVEASGGVTLATVASIAETGVDFVSVGSLTHSAPALDLSLLLTQG